MIVYSRTSTIAPGHQRECMEFAHEIAGYIHKTYGVQVRVLTPLAGNPFRISWRGRFDSLADFEAMRARQAGDETFAAILQKSVGLFLPGSAEDELWHGTEG